MASKRTPSRIPRLRPLGNLNMSPAQLDEGISNRKPPWRPFSNHRVQTEQANTGQVHRGIENALHEHLYLYEQSGPNAFVVCGEDARRLYKVMIGPQTCSGCRTKQCKHLLFVMLRILKVQRDDPKLTAPSLRNYEVVDLVKNFHDGRRARRHPKRFERKRDRASECSICLRDMAQNEPRTSCYAGCGHAMHLKCMCVWAEATHSRSQPLVCPLCRCSWRQERKDSPAEAAPTEDDAKPSLERFILSPSRSLAMQEHFDGTAGSDMELSSCPTELNDQAKPWLPAVGQRVVCNAFSGDWRSRSRAVFKLHSWLAARAQEPLTNLERKAVCGLLEQLVQDAVFCVYSAALSLVPLLERDTTELKPSFQTILTRCSDSNRRYRDRALDALSEVLIRQILPIDAIIEAVCSRTSEDTALHEMDWSWALGRLNALKHLMARHSSFLQDHHTAALQEWVAHLVRHRHLWVYRRATALRRSLNHFVAARQHDGDTSSDDDMSMADCASLDSDGTDDEGDGHDTPAADKQARGSRSLERRDSSSAVSDMSSEQDAVLYAHGTGAGAALPVIGNGYVLGAAWKRGKMLGRGACCATYLGVDIKTAYRFAAKLIELDPAACARSCSQASVLQQEIDVLCRIPPHDNVVGFLGSCFEEHRITLFTEFMAGGTISNHVGEFGAISEHAAASFGRQILSGLGHLHKMRIIHRDLKGSNLLLDQSGTRVKIADFGLAAVLAGDATQADEFKHSRGTPAFMAPEVIRGEGYGRRADMWSFGCCMIEMLSGMPPFAEHQADNHYALMFMIASSDVLPSMPSHVSAPCQEAVMCCLDRVPSQRPRPTELLYHDFFVC